MRVLILSLCIVAATIYIYAQDQNPWRKKAVAESVNKMALISAVPNTLSNWPPKVGAPFPEVKLFDLQGSPFNLQTLNGKPTLIEFVAMTCAACEGFSGGNKYGGFKGFAVQPRLPSLEEITMRYGSVNLHSNDINFIQIIIYNLGLDAPTKHDLIEWSEHFHFNDKLNTKVLGADPSLLNRDSFNMIPGFMLLDSSRTVCFDSTGHYPRHNMYSELTPNIRQVISTGRCPRQ